jgi:methionyl-tRNA formyltransferase
MTIKLGKKSFVVLTTSFAGLQMAKGLVRAGHSLIVIGIGASSSDMPISSVSCEDASRILSPNISINNVSLDEPEAVKRFFEQYTFDFALISWPKLLGRSALQAAHNHVMGSHPTYLPYGRGRHPLHWLRVLGISCSSVTAFWLDLGIDSGRIVGSIPFRINWQADVATDLRIVEKAYFRLGLIVGLRFLFGLAKGRHQDLTTGTTWRKRVPADTHIDFRMSAAGIVQHVRSIARPWPLATMRDPEGNLLRIVSARPAPLALIHRKNRWSTLGDILIDRKQINERQVLMRCYGGAVWLTVLPDDDLRA